MTEQQKQAIIESGKQYFRSIIIPNHLKNLNKLHLSSFDINPFLINYLAAFIKEDSQIIGLAKALVYPHIFDKVIDASSEQDVQSLVPCFRKLPEEHPILMVLISNLLMLLTVAVNSVSSRQESKR